jgi:hypothetical protein
MTNNPTVKEDTGWFDFMEDAQESSLEIRHHSWEVSLENILKQVEGASERALSIKIVDQMTLELVLDLSAEVMNIKDRIEECRKKATKPQRDIIQKINDEAKKITAVLDRVKASITIKISEWQLQQELLAIEAKEKVSRLADSLGLNVDILAPDAPRVVSSDKASTVVKETRTFEITDPSLVPDEYWVIDEKLIQNHVNLGKNDIAGIKIITEKNLHIRRK